MSHKNIHTKEFIVGAIVGSLLGGVTALLSAPSSGKRLREDICEACNDISEKGHHLAKKGKFFTKNLSGYDWAGKAKSTVDGVKKNLQHWTSHEDEEGEGMRDLLIGALAGSVFGAVVGLLLAPKPGQKLVHDLVDRYDDINEKAKEYSRKSKTFAKKARSKANQWIDFARDIVEELSEETHEKGEDLIEKAKDFVHNDRVNNLIDWASFGYRLWQGVKSKR